MPEGPEVKTVARTLAERLVGKTLGDLWHSPHRLRKAANYTALAQLKNQTVNDVSSYGKVLFITANKTPAIIAQLGMTGQLFVCDHNDPVMPHTHVRWRLQSSRDEIRYVDPRRFGLIDTCNEKTKNEVLKKLGPDPFYLKKSGYQPLIAAMKKSSRAIKEVLLDQSIIAGVGNIYAAEALFVAGINPKQRALDIDNDAYERLLRATTLVMELGYKNCGTSFSNYVDGSGKKGSNIQFVNVFQKAGLPCKTCHTTIDRIKQGGRSTFYCPSCQKIPKK